MIDLKTQRRIAVAVLIFVGFFSGVLTEYFSYTAQVKAEQKEHESMAATNPAINPVPVATGGKVTNQQNQANIQKKVVTSTNVDVSTLRKATVKQVIDGDTFELTTGEKVRLIGVDAPDGAKPDAPVQPYAKEAADYTRNMLSGKTVYLEKDVSQTDKYGRYPRYAYLENGTFFNEQLLKNGYARLTTMPPDVKYQNRLLTAERYAKDNRKGLWAIQTTSPGKPPATDSTKPPATKN